MKFIQYTENYRHNLDKLCTFDGFINADLFNQAKVFIPASLTVIDSPDTPQKQFNCHGYTFGENAWFGSDKVFNMLRESRLVEVPEPEYGSVIIYFDEKSKFGGIRHSGIYIGRGRVRSKWSNGPVFGHDVFNVPFSYGNNIKFFEYIR